MPPAEGENASDPDAEENGEGGFGDSSSSGTGSVADASLDARPPPERLEVVSGNFNRPIEVGRTFGFLETASTIFKIHHKWRQPVGILIGAPELIPINGDQGQAPVGGWQPRIRWRWAVREVCCNQAQMK